MTAKPHSPVEECTSYAGETACATVMSQQLAKLVVRLPLGFGLSCGRKSCLPHRAASCPSKEPNSRGKHSACQGLLPPRQSACLS